MNTVYLGGLREYNKVVRVEQGRKNSERNEAINARRKERKLNNIRISEGLFKTKKRKKKKFKPKNNKQKQKRLTGLDYKRFLKSPHWIETRRKFYASTVLKECCACRSESNLNLHHTTYDRLGFEQDGDLVLLCQPCHKEVHRLHKLSNKNLLEVTTDFIQSSSKRIWGV